MNNLIVSAFKILNEVAGVVLMLASLAIAVFLFSQKEIFFGVLVGVGGPLVVIVVTGFASLFIEMQKDLRSIRDLLKDSKSKLN